jgi:hypothetical protein
MILETNGDAIEGKRDKGSKPSEDVGAADPEEVPALESFAGGAIVGGGFPSLAAPLL